MNNCPCGLKTRMLECMVQAAEKLESESDKEMLLSLCSRKALEMDICCLTQLVLCSLYSREQALAFLKEARQTFLTLKHPPECGDG